MAMDTITLKAILRAERAAAMGDGVSSDQGSELAAQRSISMDYYLGDMTEHMPSVEGRSSAVSTDVADTVDGMMPSLMDIFTASDEVAKFEAVGPEDEDEAQQETDYVNHVFYNENPGFKILHAMVKDALIQKNGIAKFWWEEGEEEERETYMGLDEDSFTLLVADKSVELIEHTATPDITYGVLRGSGNAQPMLHDATVIKRKPYGCVKVVPVPPEEFLIARDAKDIKDSRYCAHKVQRTRSQLIEQGYPRAKVEALPSGSQVPGTEQAARDTVNDSDQTAAEINKAMQLIDVTEHFIRLDYDEDGVAELRKVTTAGPADEVLDNEPYDRMPFAAITPILMSHRFWGRSLADIVADIQKIKTALIRALLDNAYFANNQRIEIAETHAGDHTLDDLLTNRPGGVVRTKAPGGLLPIPTTPIGQHLFPTLEYMDVIREIRTGVQRNAVGPDANSLNPYSNTATGANILATAAQQRIRLIARTFAETGIKDLFMGIHELILKHGKDARKVKLRDEWVTVDPRAWKTRKDMTVLVGLGTGTRDQVNGYLSNILGMQIKALELQGGAGGPVVTLTNVYNTLKKLTENAGFRSAEPFFTAPSPEDEMKAKQPPPPDPKVQAMQMKAQLDQQKAQTDMAAKQQDMEIKRESAQMDLQKAVLEMRLELQKFMMEMGMKRQEFALEQQQDAQRFGEELRQSQVSSHVSLQQQQRAGEQKLELAEQAAKQKADRIATEPRSKD
jgi:hypothetical protein